MSVRTLAVMAAACALAAPALAQTPQLRAVPDEGWCNDEYSDRDRSRTCAVYEATWAGGTPISVDARPNGGISVEGWDRGEVRLRAMLVTVADDEAEARQIASQVRIQAGPAIRADGPARNGRGGPYWWVSYRLSVPRRSSLTLESTNGGIHLSGVEGDIKAATTNGGLHLKEVGGRVNGRTTNGGLHVVLSGSEWRGDGLDLVTTNGGVHVVLPRGYNARLQAATTNGRVHSEFVGSTAGGEDEAGEDDDPALHRHQRRARRTVNAVLGSGGALLRFRTTNGGVHIGQE